MTLEEKDTDYLVAELMHLRARVAELEGVNGDLPHSEVLLVPRDELEVLVEQRTAQLFNANEELKREVAERHRIEEELRQSQEQLHRIIDNLDDALYRTDMTGTFTYLSPGSERIAGYTPEEGVGRKITEFYADPLERQEFLKLVMTQGHVKGFEARLVRKDGSIVWVSTSARIVRDKEGSPIGVEGITRDITDQKRMVTALQESEERYRVLAENSLTGICVHQDNKIVYINKRAAQGLGYTVDELVGKPIRGLVAPDDRVMLNGIGAARVRGEQVPTHYEFRAQTRSGEIRWVELLATLIEHQGRPAILANLRDVTDRRRMEQEVVKVQKLESLGILAGGIAHDFNNILTAILGNISLAKAQDSVPEKAVSRLTEAEKACMRAQGLTKQLLTFSKGGAPIKTTVRMGSLITDSCELALRGTNARCECSFPDDLWPADVDEGQICQVLNNLVINAEHAIPQGGVIRVHADNVALCAGHGLPLPDGDYVRIAVKDTGVGIPPEILPRVFDPYFTTKQNGSGLGLATAYSIISNHEGAMTVESEPGVGSAFTIYLPASTKEPAPVSVPEDTIAAGSGRILLMDDEPSIREMAAEMMGMLGYEVSVAKDGAEAIELFLTASDSAKTFDVVILDLTVQGGMSGLEAMQRLREIDPNVRAIVSSGYSNDPIMSDYRNYGFSGVVAKPYTAKELSRALAAVVVESDHE